MLTEIAITYGSCIMAIATAVVVVGAYDRYQTRKRRKKLVDAMMETWRDACNEKAEARKNEENRPDRSKN